MPMWLVPGSVRCRARPLGEVDERTNEVFIETCSCPTSTSCGEVNHGFQSSRRRSISSASPCFTFSPIKQRLDLLIDYS